MLDSRPPAPSAGEPAWHEAMTAAWFAEDLGRIAGVDVPVSAAALVRLAPGDRARHVRALALQAGALPAQVDQDLLERLMRVFDAHVRALASYRPTGRYRGQALLVSARGAGPGPASASGPASGWAELIDGNVEVTSVPGDHYTMLREPAVRAVAARVESFLGREVRS
jgi:thioesterase domain-containing protein